MERVGLQLQLQLPRQLPAHVEKQRASLLCIVTGVSGACGMAPRLPSGKRGGGPEGAGTDAAAGGKHALKQRGRSCRSYLKSFPKGILRKAWALVRDLDLLGAEGPNWTEAPNNVPDPLTQTGSPP